MQIVNGEPLKKYLHGECRKCDVILTWIGCHDVDWIKVTHVLEQ
jgi:hypothetical protein